MTVRRKRLTRIDLLMAALFFVGTLLLRLPTFYQTVLSWDVGFYQLVAQKMLLGQLPYVTIWDHKPPGIFALFALIQLLLGQSVIAIRLVAVLVIAVTSYFLYLIGKLISGNLLAGILAGILYSVLSLSNEGLDANTEPFYLFFVVVAFYLLIEANPELQFSKITSRRLLFISMALGIGLQINFLVAFDILAILAINVGSLYAKSTRITGTLIKNTFRFVCCLLIGPVILFALTTGVFALFGAQRDFIEAVFLANLAYSADVDISFVGLLDVIRRQIDTNAFLYISLGLSIFYLLGRNNLSRREKRTFHLLLVWLAMTIVAILFARRFYPHYFLHILPAASLLSACLYVSIVDNRLAPPVSNRYRIIMVCLFVLVPLIQNAWPSINTGIQMVYFRNVHGLEHWRNETKVIADYLSERIDPEDYIYSVDYPPVIYYLVPAKVPTRYAMPSELTDPHNSYIGINPINELNAIIGKRPVYIIRQYQIDNAFYAQLDNYLNKLYTLEKTINGVDLFRLNY